MAQQEAQPENNEDRVMFHPAAYRDWARLSDATQDALLETLGRVAASPPGQFTVSNVKPITAGNNTAGTTVLVAVVRVNKRETRILFTNTDGALCVFDVQEGYKPSIMKGADRDSIVKVTKRRRELSAGEKTVWEGPPLSPRAEEPATPARATAELPPFEALDACPARGHAAAQLLRSICTFTKPGGLSTLELAEFMAPRDVTSRDLGTLEGLDLIQRVQGVAPNRYVPTALGIQLAACEPTRVSVLPDERAGWWRDAREDPFALNYKGPLMQREVIVTALKAMCVHRPNGVTANELWNSLSTQDQRVVNKDFIYGQLYGLAQNGSITCVQGSGGEAHKYMPAGVVPTEAKVIELPQPVAPEAEPETEPEPEEEEEPMVERERTMLTATEESPRQALISDAENFCAVLGASFYAALTKEERKPAIELLESIESFLAKLKTHDGV